LGGIAARPGSNLLLHTSCRESTGVKTHAALRQSGPSIIPPAADWLQGGRAQLTLVPSALRYARRFWWNATLARCGAETALAPTSTGALGSLRECTQSRKF